MIQRMFLLGLTAAALAGCAGVEKSDMTTPEKTATINEAYTLAPQTTWQRRVTGAMERWTVAGPRLHQLRLYGDLPPGEGLFPEQRKRQLPEWSGRHRAHAIADFLRASLAQWGAIDVEVNNLRPAAFGDRAGFRMDLSFAAPSGLAYQGLVAGTTNHGQDARLQLIVYFGTASHHFSAYEDDVEALLESVSFGASEQ